MAELFENRVKRMLKAGKKTAGAWSQLCSPASTEILCRAGFDWILIDMEHSPSDMQTLLAMLQAMGGYGAVPIVRAPWNDMVWIKRILDAGAYGVMVPSVNTREQAIAAVQACKYPPVGVRGIAGSPRAAGFGRDTVSYLKRANDEILVILQVETPQAVENLEEIGRVPGGRPFHRAHGPVHLHGAPRGSRPPGGAGSHCQSRGEGQGSGHPAGDDFRRMGAGQGSV